MGQHYLSLPVNVDPERLMLYHLLVNWLLGGILGQVHDECGTVVWELVAQEIDIFSC